MDPCPFPLFWRCGWGLHPHVDVHESGGVDVHDAVGPCKSPSENDTDNAVPCTLSRGRWSAPTRLPLDGHGAGVGGHVRGHSRRTMATEKMQRGMKNAPGPPEGAGGGGGQQMEQTQLQ